MVSTLADSVRHLPQRVRRDERAASLVEYALLVTLIAVVCVAGVTTLGGATSSSFDSAVTRLDNP